MPKLRKQIEARLAALRRVPTGELARRWEVQTRIAHRRIKRLTLDGAPPGLLYFAWSRRSHGMARGDLFHGLECRRADTGALVWQREVTDWGRQALVADGLLVLGTLDGLVALDPRSGALRWHSSTTEERPAAADGDLPPARPVPPRVWRTEHERVVAIAAARGRVHAATADGKVIALSADTGERLWSVRLDGRQFLADGLLVRGKTLWACMAFPAALQPLDAESGEMQPRLKLSDIDPRVTDRPAFDSENGRLYLVLGDRSIHAIDLASGRETWTNRLRFGIEKILLSADGARCYVVPSSFANRGEIVSLDPATGDALRRRSLRIGSLADAVLGPDALFVAQRNEERDLVIHALDPQALTLRWQSVPMGLSHPTPLAAGRDVLAVAGRRLREPVALVVDAATGKLAAELRPAGADHVSVDLADDLVCVGSDRGLFAYGPADREQLDERIAALQARVDAGDRHALLSLANALYRRDREQQAIRLLDRALRDESLGLDEALALEDRLRALQEALARRRPAQMSAPRLAVGPKVDGSIDEPWRADAAVYLDGPAAVYPVQGRDPAASRWRSPSDLSAVLYTAWDERRFYFAIDVTDDIHRTYTGESDTWVGDGLIICIDSRNEGGYGYSFGGSHILLTLALTRKDERRDDRDDESPDGEYRVRRKDDNSGTVYEVAVPWEYLGLRPRPGLRFGFNVTVTDDDGSQAAKAVSWGPGMILDQRRALMIRGFTPEYFGDVILTGPREGQGPQRPPPPVKLITPESPSDDR